MRRLRHAVINSPDPSGLVASLLTRYWLRVVWVATN